MQRLFALLWMTLLSLTLVNRNGLPMVQAVGTLRGAARSTEQQQRRRNRRRRLQMDMNNKNNKKNTGGGGGGGNNNNNNGGDDADPLDCIDNIESLELFDLDPEDHIGDAEDPCFGRDNPDCMPISSVLDLYPGIDTFERTECLSPDDCDGECRIHSTGLACDENDGPFFHLTPICPQDVVIPIPETPITDEPEEPEDPMEDPMEPTEPEDPVVPTEPEDPEEDDNSKVMAPIGETKFRHQIPGAR